MKKMLVVSMLALGAVPAAQAEISFDLLHTLPECFGRPIPARTDSLTGEKFDAVTSDGKPAGTFCTGEDRVRVAGNAGLEARVQELIGKATDPSSSRITVAYFSFSNSKMFESLCAAGKAGVEINAYFDQANSATPKIDGLRSCGPKVKVNVLGVNNWPAWRLHHNKFLMVEPNVNDSSSTAYINFSSGNASSSGLSIHFDHWVYVTAPRNSNVYKMHSCVATSLQKALTPGGQEPDDPNVYRSELEKCLKNSLYVANDWQGKWIENAISKERVAPLFSPDPNDGNAQALIKMINSIPTGGRIFGAIQHFKHGGIARALQKAAKERKVQVRLIMDDDVLLGDSEVPGVREFYDANIAPSKSGWNVHFMQTNAESLSQMMHMKYLVMDGVQANGKKGLKRVFSGAGHFTSSAMQGNYENFYLTQDPVLWSKYEAMFNYMWQRSLSQEQVEKKIN